MTDFSYESLFDGCLTIKQGKSGYRFSIDPILLSHFARPNPGDHIIDLGSGCGIIPAILSIRHPETLITGIEIQKELAKLARENTLINSLNNVSILCGDMRDICRNQLLHCSDLVITNPPYTKKNSGRLNPDSEKAVARHEIKITLHELLEAAFLSLKKGGRFVIIYPQGRLVDLLFAMRDHRIEPKYLRMIHPKKNNPAKLVLVEGVTHGGPGLTVHPPLYIYDAPSVYSTEVQKMFQGC